MGTENQLEEVDGHLVMLLIRLVGLERDPALREHANEVVRIRSVAHLGQPSVQEVTHTQPKPRKRDQSALGQADEGRGRHDTSAVPGAVRVPRLATGRLVPAVAEAPGARPGSRARGFANTSWRSPSTASLKPPSQ